MTSEMENRVYRALDELKKCRTDEDRLRVFESHPELMTDEADATLEQLARIQPTPDARERVRQLRKLFNRYWEMKIGPDLEDKILTAVEKFMAVPTAEDSLRVLEEHPELMRDEAEVVLRQMEERQPDADARTNVRNLRALLRQLKPIGRSADLW